jgi:hypothetical protein
MLHVCIFDSHLIQNISLVDFYDHNFLCLVLRETVTFKRSIIVANNTPDWANSMKPMIPMNFVAKGSIADAHNMAQVNFANK